jgi:hypothetical protein
LSFVGGANFYPYGFTVGDIHHQLTFSKEKELVAIQIPARNIKYITLLYKYIPHIPFEKVLV